VNREDELRHLDFGPEPGERSDWAGVIEARLETGADAGLVVARARGVVRTLWSKTQEQLAEGDSSGLPRWLLATFAPSIPDEMDRKAWWESPHGVAWWGGLGGRTRRMVETYCSWDGLLVPWRFDAWLYAFSEEERSWRWWGSRVDGPRRAGVFFEVDGWPYAWENLEWLLAAAGADVVENMG
jgi:hypothetical protein